MAAIGRRMAAEPEMMATGTAFSCGMMSLLLEQPERKHGRMLTAGGTHPICMKPASRSADPSDHDSRTGTVKATLMNQEFCAPALMKRL